MTIKPGDRLPEAAFTTMTSQGTVKLTTSDVFAGKKVVLFAVPGAFTPTCHMKHLPGFIARADEIKARGVATIACLSVNDAFVMDAWAQSTGADDKILFLADGGADFTRAIGMDVDIPGLGVRSSRYAMIVEDGKVTALNIETARGQITETGADAIIGLL